MNNGFVDFKRGKIPVDAELYQIARDEVLTKLTIPQYFMDFIDPEINLEIKPNCLCPFHEESTPSFRYKGEENFWRCFGKCRVGGTVIELHQHLHKLSGHYEALIDLQKKHGKKYNLNFKNFILDVTNRDISIEKVLEKKSSSLSFESFMKSSKPSVNSLSEKIEKELLRLKNKDKNKYIEACIMYDNAYVYKTFNQETLTEILQIIKNI